MTLLRRVLRLLRPVVETVLAGVLIGVIAMAFVQEVAPGGSPASTGELPLARSYMMALIHNDLDTMSQLAPSIDTLTQALNFQQRADALKNLKIDSLTYLGGQALGSEGVHVYVVEAEGSSGQQLIPVTVTVFEGKVVRVDA